MLVNEAPAPAPIIVLSKPELIAVPESLPTAVFLSPELKLSNAPIPTPVLSSAELKVPCVVWPTNKLSVKFVPSVLLNKSTFKVTSPDVPPPDKPVPAVTPLISPTPSTPE